LVASIFIAMAASAKGRSGAGFFFLSFFISFVIALIIVLVISPTDQARLSVRDGNVGKVGPVQCPHCKELIRPDANVCKHCGKEVAPVLPTLILQNVERVEEEEKRKAEAAEFAAGRRKEFLSKRSTRIGAISLASAVVLALGIVVSANVVQQNASDEALRVRTQKIALQTNEAIEKFGNWSEIVSRCKEVPSGMTGLATAQDNSSLSFSLTYPINTEFGGAYWMTEDQRAWLECFSSMALLEVQELPNSQTDLVKIIQVFPYGHFSDHLDALIYLGIHTDCSPPDEFDCDPQIQIDGDLPDVSYDKGGPFYVTISKTQYFGRTPAPTPTP
jgi:hypothetical protein